jgi:hypothetical protein
MSIRLHDLEADSRLRVISLQAEHAKNFEILRMPVIRGNLELSRARLDRHFVTRVPFKAALMSRPEEETLLGIRDDHTRLMH